MEFFDENFRPSRHSTENFHNFELCLAFSKCMENDSRLISKLIQFLWIMLIIMLIYPEYPKKLFDRRFSPQKPPGRVVTDLDFSPKELV
jgi:hypothetical protein